MGEEDKASTPYANACAAVAALTTAWHSALAIDPQRRGDAIEQIERALESAVRMRERLKAR